MFLQLLPLQVPLCHNTVCTALHAGMLRAADGMVRASPAASAPAHASPLRSVRHGQQPVPFPLVWLLAASLFAVALLSAAHASLVVGPAASSTRARRLMQRIQHEAALHADPADGRRAGDAASAAGLNGRASGMQQQGEGGVAADQQQPQQEGLTSTADLATVAAPGLLCEVTPSHSKVPRRCLALRPAQPNACSSGSGMTGL